MTGDRAKANPPTPDAKVRVPPRMGLGWKGANTLTLRQSGDMGRIDGATGNIDVTDELTRQIAALGSYGHRSDEGACNFALGFVDSMKPKDAAEALLMAQMAANHQATMMLARRLNHIENLPQQDAAERALNKLARTYAGQLEALKRYRSKGHQVVRVERVTVQSGAQAIVGTVQAGEGQR